MPFIFYKFQNQVNKIDFDSSAITAEKAKFLISQAIGTSDVLELTDEADGTRVKERQLLTSGMTVSASRTANKSFRQSMRDIGGSQHKKRMRGGPNTGDVVIGISQQKHPSQLGNVYYTGAQQDLGSLEDPSSFLSSSTAHTSEIDSHEERKFKILEQSVRTTNRPEFGEFSHGQLPLRSSNNFQRKQTVVRSSDTIMVDPPGGNYVCHACGYAGHWIYDCEIVKNSGEVSSQADAPAQKHRNTLEDPKENESAQKSEKEAKIIEERKKRFALMRSWTPEERKQADENVLREAIWTQS